MAIQDSDPARRNLTVTSFAFIVFSLAGGYFDHNVVRLQVVNLKFENPEALALFAWALLLWFAYRFWQTRKGMTTTMIRAEIKGNMSGLPRKVLYKRILKKQNQPPIEIKTDFKKSSLYFRFRTDKEAETTYETGKIEGIFLTVMSYLHTIFRSPEITDRITPYLLFVMAVLFNFPFSFIIDSLS